MITVREAKKIIAEAAIKPKVKDLELYRANGSVLATDVFSPINVPPFNQSAMDGYALKFSQWAPGNSLKLIGVLQAGVAPQNDYPSGSALRIFTGAQVPSSYDTVVMQEKTRRVKEQIFITDEQLKEGMNVRLEGSQNQKGTLALNAGTIINAGVAGYLAGLGFNQVKVFEPPKVCIINTGKELIQPGKELPPGKIFESNSYSLNAALNNLNINPLALLWCDDDESQLTQMIKDKISDCDYLILSGGVSVGDYDFVHQALANCGVQCLFHKVKQKPGKPLYFGKKDNTLVFGLPGNPAAVLTCFYEYIAPSLKTYIGKPETKELTMPLAVSYSKKAGLTHFLKGKISGKEVQPLHAQESYLMNSFAVADCIIELEENRTDFEKGELVPVNIINA